jgi:ABC-type Fe3+-hydroxamate transport system substrate-binding protein
MIIDPPRQPRQKRYSRIISLVPSQTELLHYLGLEVEVVGITKFCIHPIDWHTTKPKIGGTKTINIPAVHDLRPDLVIANKEENVKEQVEELAKSYDVLVTDVNDLNEALQMIKDIGNVTGRSDASLELAAAIAKTFDTLGSEPAADRDLQSAYIIWKDPFMAAGGDTFINDMMRYCGLSNVFGGATRYPQLSMKDLANGCRLILLSSEPYPFKEEHVLEFQKVLPGVKIILVDGEMFSWYGSRLLQAAGYFRDLMQQVI